MTNYPVSLVARMLPITLSVATAAKIARIEATGMKVWSTQLYELLNHKMEKECL